jgi:peptide deformylase
VTVRPILLWPDPALSQACAPVPAGADVTDLVTDLFETMYDARGRGLAAPQLGAMQRVFVLDCGWKDGAMTPLACINPRIVAASDARRTGEEVCLSIPGVAARVTRAASVTLRFTGLDGARAERVLTGAEAVCAQHELDHLDGLVTFDRVDPEARAALLAGYGGAVA